MNMKMLCICVIIPVFNCEKYIEEAVLSVIEQPYQNINIIIVDDGSTDSTPDICDKLVTDYSRIQVIHQNNSGVSAARNAGIEFALSSNCNYIAFLDADDKWNSNVITEELVITTMNSAEKDVILFGSVRCTEDCCRYSYPVVFNETCLEGGNEVIWKAPHHFGASLYNIELFMNYRVRFCEDLRYSEDKIFKMQCEFLARRVQYLPQILYIYRKNSASAMSRINLIQPFDYYLPIIDGWIKSDEFLNSFSVQTGKTICSGNVLAGIYFGDMVRDYYKLHKFSLRLIDIKTLPHYSLFLKMERKDVSSKQYNDQQLMVNHPMIYKIKYNFIGVVEYFLKLLLRIPCIRRYKQKFDYPLTAFGGV